ncbi:MAG: flagellar hook-associated protein FlgK [Bacteroidetes bacterium]|jgi:flagellar hook-associated protein 1 FlgK|nr:flagellar hook-associated protein FlgK [Bacteroidota bacterium]
MGINQIIEMGRRSLRTFDAGMNTVSQNIANAESEGYHRRRITINSVATDSRGVVIGPPGATDRLGGAGVGSFERLRDRLFTAMGREASTGLGAGEEEARLLDGVESVFGVGTEGSLSNVLSGFWNGWSDLADNPTDIGTREALLRKAQNLTSTLNRVDSDLNRIRNEAAGTLGRSVDDVNDKLNRIAELNERIQKSRNNGSPNYSAEDERDQLVKDVAEYVPVKVLENQNDGYQVTVNGMSVVQGTNVVELDLQNGTTPPNPPDKLVYFEGTNKTFQPAPNRRGDGKIGALLRTLNDTLRGVQSDLDTLSGDIVTQVNGIHSNGYDLNGVQGGTFFDPANTTAGDISLSDDLRDPDGPGPQPVGPALLPERIAAAAEDPATPGTSDGPGNSDQALSIFDLRETLENEAIRIVSDVGNQLDEAQKTSSAQSGVLAQVDAMESGVSGVSIDEELTKMIEYQQSFAASSRIIQTAQQMMDTLLAI